MTSVYFKSELYDPKVDPGLRTPGLDTKLSESDNNKALLLF